jgi:hypothetical protein
VVSLFGMIEFLYILLLLWIAVAGPGCVSVDSKLCKGRGNGSGA